jgi:hypothetical protein
MPHNIRKNYQLYKILKKVSLNPILKEKSAKEVEIINNFLRDLYKVSIWSDNY